VWRGRKKTYSIQLSARKLIDLVDVDGETIDDGAGYGFDARFDHFCAVLIRTRVSYGFSRMGLRRTHFYDPRGCFSLFVDAESRADEWECGHARDEGGWGGVEWR
jgi:hypothetical protein